MTTTVVDAVPTRRSATWWRDRVCGIGDEAAPDLAGQLTVLSNLGLRAIELRSVDGRLPHELDGRQLAELAEAIATAGFTVPVIDTPIGNWATTIATDERTELAVLTGSIGAARGVGCRFLRIMRYPDDGRGEPAWGRAVRARLRRLAGVAADHGVVLLHENCHGWAADDPARATDLLDHVDSDALRLVFDIGNGLAYGYSAVDYLGAVLPWVEHVHVKDGHPATSGRPARFAVPGTGVADVAGCLRILVESGYGGRFSLEPHVAHIPHLAATGDRDALAAGFGACADGVQTLLGSVLSGTRHG